MATAAGGSRRCRGRAAAEQLKRASGRRTSTVHEDSLSPTFHACCSFGGVSSSGAQVRVQILDHDETLLSLAPDPVIGDARASLSADVGTQQVALTIRGSPLPGQAAGTVKLNSWFIADDPKDASLQAVAVVAAMPGGNSMQGVRATITPDFRSPEASAAGFVAHASAVEHAGLEDQYTVSVPAGSPYSRFIAVPRQDDAHLAFRIEDATGGWSAWSHVDPERASSGGLLSDGRATGLREYVAPVKAAAVKDFRVHLRVTSADGTATRLYEFVVSGVKPPSPPPGPQPPPPPPPAPPTLPDGVRGAFQACALNASGILNGDSGLFGDVSDAFVRIAVRSDPNAEVLVAEDGGSGKSCTTHPIKNSLSPKFDKCCDFGERPSGEWVDVWLFDADRQDDEPIGHAVVSDALSRGGGMPHEFKVRLEPQGTLWLRTTFTEAGWQPGQQRGAREDDWRHGGPGHRGPPPKGLPLGAVLAIVFVSVAFTSVLVAAVVHRVARRHYARLSVGAPSVAYAPGPIQMTELQPYTVPSSHASARAAEMMSSPLVQPISAVVVSEP